MTETTHHGLDRMRAPFWLATATLIFLPLILMKIADPGAWDSKDLPFAFVMFAAVGLAFECALRVPVRLAYQAGVALAVATALLLTWGNLAVGFAGSEDNWINIVFFAVPVVAGAGSLIARFRSAGLAVAMAGAAIAQLATGLIAFYYGYFTGPLTVSFIGLWVAASLVFLRNSRERTPSRDRLGGTRT